jgi:RNase P/RNase MRP subunit p29
MKKILIFACAFLFVAAVAFAVGPKTYQVTGPVLEVNANTIVVEKGKDKWEINRDGATKVTGDLKVGSKVTIEYTMKAATIEVKEAKAAAAKKEPKKK